MRTRLSNYKITIDSVNNKVSVHIETPPVSVGENYVREITESIRLIIDETSGIIFCSSKKKSDTLSISTSSETGYAYKITFDIPNGKTVSINDYFTIEFDWGTSIESVKSLLEYLTTGCSIVQTGEGVYKLVVDDSISIENNTIIA